MTHVERYTVDLLKPLVDQWSDEQADAADKLIDDDDVCTLLEAALTLFLRVKGSPADEIVVAVAPEYPSDTRHPFPTGGLSHAHDLLTVVLMEVAKLARRERNGLAAVEPEGEPDAVELHDDTA